MGNENLKRSNPQEFVKKTVFTVTRAAYVGPHPSADL